MRRNNNSMLSAIFNTNKKSDFLIAVETKTKRENFCAQYQMAKLFKHLKWHFELIESSIDTPIESNGMNGLRL